MANGRVTRALARERETRTWEYAQLGWTEERIGRELGITQQAVSGILHRLYKRAQQRLTSLVLEEKLRQIRLLQYIADESMQAWENSKKPKKVVSKRKSEQKGLDRDNVIQVVTEDGLKNTHPLIITGTSEETNTRAEESIGESRYLAEARAALSDIRQIMALNAPVRVEHDWTDLLPDGMAPEDAVREITAMFMQIEGDFKLLEEEQKLLDAGKRKSDEG